MRVQELEAELRDKEQVRRLFLNEQILYFIFIYFIFYLLLLPFCPSLIIIILFFFTNVLME